MTSDNLAESFQGSLHLNDKSDKSEVKTSTDEELARFRREWEAEVKRNRRGADGSAPKSSLQANDTIEKHGPARKDEGPSQSSPASSLQNRTLLVSNNSRGNRRPLTTAVQEDRPEIEEDDTLEHESSPIRLMRKAVQIYAQAVEAERGGDLDKALNLYRKAFRLDADSDKLYERASSALQKELNSPEEEERQRVDLLIETEEVRSAILKANNVEDFRYGALVRQQRQQQEDVATAKEERLLSQGERTAHSRDGRDELSLLIDKLSVQSGGERIYHQMEFEPLDEERPMPIAKLPEEILLHILSFIAAPKGRRGAKISSTLQNDSTSAEAVASASDTHRRTAGVGIVLAGPDYMSIEQLGRTCWRFRLLTRAWSVWRLIVRETYFPPQISAKIPLPTLVERHDNDWRTTFVEQPRVRLNGAYIAACHYTRAGMHEDNVWVRVVHVVEFYRSLRFLPDGRTLSLLTTDAPSQTVRKMEPSLRIKGFAIGTWKLHPQGLADDELYSRPSGPKIVVDDLKDKTMSRYTFRLILKLDKTSRGKWNRLEVLEYESINLESGEVCPLPLNHKKPFHFSAVRSYGI